MSEMLERVHNTRVYKTSRVVVSAVYGYVSDRLWPVYSTGMVVGSLLLIASMHEKQTIADHYFGAKCAKEALESEQVSAATQLMEDELQRAVKVDVYNMPASEFAAEHSQRHGA